MKRIFQVLVILIILSIGSVASAFTSGSTGADGAFNPTTSTQVQLPPDGVFNFTTVNIPSGVTVTFIKNTANTPVYILATGDVIIAGTINVSGGSGVSITSGKGGPGGFDGGYGGSSGNGGNGLGPGAGSISTNGSSYIQAGGGGGYGSAGGTFTVSNISAGSGGPAYGNSRLIPLVGGSGGAGGNWAADSLWSSIGMGGGGGGGAILIASSGTINITGSISANGGNGAPSCNGSESAAGGGGSGGAIKLMANTIAGNGTISATGGIGCSYLTNNNGGNGRIRFEANTVTRTASTSPLYTFSSPGPVFVANTPSIQITSIAGMAVSQNAAGSYITPDITLPAGTTNPVQVGISATNIPLGTVITVSVVPQQGTASNYSSTGLSGTLQSSTATASVTISTSQTSVLLAKATFTIQVAMNYDGEKITQASVVASLGGGSHVTYITESGKRVSAEQLYASLMN